jgi:hypothetical protein
MDSKRRRGLQAQVDDLQDRLNQRGVGQPTGPRKAFKTRPVGDSRAALLRRLRRDFPELHSLVLSGDITPFKASCVAGFRRPPGKKPQRPVDRTEQGHHDVLLELWLGPHPDRGSVFADADELRQAWLRHRDKAMELWGRNCRRPMGWWELETDLEYPGRDAEPRFLYEHDLLSALERAQFEAKERPPDAMLSGEVGELPHPPKNSPRGPSPSESV